jgi:hypothetical protein
LTLEDYDNSIGAIGFFSSAVEFFDNFEDFLKLSERAYEKKFAKYVKTPIIRIVDGDLIITNWNEF